MPSGVDRSLCCWIRSPSRLPSNGHWVAETTRRAKEAEAGPVLRQLYTLQERHQQATGDYAGSLNALEGGAGNFAPGVYYEFQMSGGGSAFVACGIPLDEDLGLRSFRVNQTGQVTEGTC